MPEETFSADPAAADALPETDAAPAGKPPKNAAATAATDADAALSAANQNPAMPDAAPPLNRAELEALRARLEKKYH